MLVNPSPECRRGTERRVFDDDGPAEPGVHGFPVPTSHPPSQQTAEDYAASTSTPTAAARSSHMQSCDVRSATQRTPGASSTAIMPTPGTSHAAGGIEKTIQAGATSAHEGKQQMQWPLVKGLTEVQSPGTPGSQKAGTSTAAPAAAGKAELDMQSDSIDSLTKWEPLPCLPSQIVAGYAFVIDGSVSPDIDGSGQDGGAWPCLTAVELNADGIRALCLSLIHI